MTAPWAHLPRQQVKGGGGGGGGGGLEGRGQEADAIPPLSCLASFCATCVCDLLTSWAVDSRLPSLPETPLENEREERVGGPRASRCYHPPWSSSGISRLGLGHAQQLVAAVVLVHLLRDPPWSIGAADFFLALFFPPKKRKRCSCDTWQT